ncbi:unnamed protein product [Victoria cruziana]
MAVPSLPRSFPLPPSRPLVPRLQHANLVPVSSRRCRRILAQPADLKGGGMDMDYRLGVIDEFFLNAFRKKMVQEVGWDSEKPGYDGLMEVVSRLMAKGGSNSAIQQSSVRIIRSLFPAIILDLFKKLIAPIGGGKLAAMMTARVTAATCQWLMGPCRVNSIELPDGSSCSSGVLVEKCKYLEESKCVSTCIHSCKLPTQTFMSDYMGVPLVMEPNFSDFSCQFKYGVPPSQPDEDKIFQQPCLEVCPKASVRKMRSIQVPHTATFPKI